MFKKTIKSFVGQKIISPVRDILAGDAIRDGQQAKEYIEWLESGKPVPVPHIIKQLTVKKFARDYKPRIFIETGTYFGDMVWAVKDTFEKIYSIELEKNLYRRAKAKFSKYKHISIIQGDSAEALPGILDAVGITW